MSTAVSDPHPKPVAPPSGVAITLNTDGTCTIVQGGNTISLTNVESVRKLWQALAATTG